MQTSQSQSVRQFVRAGAGAGKTWNLTRQVVSRALAYHEKHGQWPKTVMTTFTRKATQELKERLLTYCLQEEPEAIEFVQSSSFLMITTMHGLFDRLLRNYGFSIGLPSQYKVVDSYQGDYWRKKVIREMMTSTNEHSELLMSFDIRRLLDLLKSYEEIYWYKSYKASTVENFSQISFHLARKWGEQLQEISQRASSEVDGEKWEEYLHYLNDLWRILKADVSWGQLQKDLEKTLGRVSKPRRSKNNPGLSQDLDDSLKKTIDDIKLLVNEPEFQEDNWKKSVLFYEKFQKLADDYMTALYKMKLKESSIEANDLENYALRLSMEKPEIVKRFSQDWDLWFIDEFQDTSPKQLQVIESFMLDKPCYIVGDPQQSIYLFRGSRSEVFFDKQKRMEISGDQLTQLQTNYRSQEKLLNFINQFFPFVSSQFQTMEAMVEGEPDGASVTISKVNAEEDGLEIKHLTQQIKELLDQGVSPKDICVLGRTNSDLDQVQKRMMRLGFPVISHSAANYYSRREIIDAQSLLQVLINPWDNVNLITWMRSPWMGLSDNEILGIVKGSEGAYWPVFKKYFSENESFAAGQKLLQAMNEKKEWGIGWVLRKLLISLGFIDYTYKIDSTGRREANLWKFINMVEKVSREPGGHLLKIVEEGSLVTSLDEVGQNSDASSPVEPDKINLMTIHASKGLQFDYIFVPFLQKRMNKTTHANFCSLEEGKNFSFRVPLGEHQKFIGTPLEKSYLKNMSHREQEESLRVLYVGLTRAKRELFLSWTGKAEKSSWARLFENFIEQNELDDSVNVLSVDSADESFYQSQKSTGQVPRPLEPMNRIYISPDREEKISGEGYQEQDLLAGQSKRWQGVVLHKLFESLKFHNVDQVKELAKKWLPSDYEKAVSAIDYVVGLKEVPLLEIIQSGHVEWGYQKEESGKLIERRVDLWGIYNEELWVVDYKTGSQRFKDKAFEQLSEYGEALKEHLSWEGKINYCVVYPFESKIFQMNS